MKKTHVAFQMSTERLAERGKLFFWTFTFPEKLDIVETRTRWNYLLTQMRRQWPAMCGLRVFEMHKTHGLHVHLVTNTYIDVNIARKMAIKAGWGRIFVDRMPAEKAGYLGKYLSKERPPCFKRWRLWAGFGADWNWTKVGGLEKNSAFCRMYRHFKTSYGWEGKQGFFKRMEFTTYMLDALIAEGQRGANRGRMGKLREVLFDGGEVLIT